MQSAMIITLTLAMSTGATLARPASSPSAISAPSGTSVSAKSREAASQQGSHLAAVADCERMWDPGTHMTRKEWSRTCRRVQNRLQQFDVK